jgi:hypothetical protein
MSLTIYSGTMIPAPIEAVLVTDENMTDVAVWCGGVVDGAGFVYVDGPFIGHDVYPGEWIVKHNGNFTPHSFQSMANWYRITGEVEGE